MLKKAQLHENSWYKEPFVQSLLSSQVFTAGSLAVSKDGRQREPETQQKGVSLSGAVGFHHLTLYKDLMLQNSSLQRVITVLLPTISYCCSVCICEGLCWIYIFIFCWFAASVVFCAI